MSYQLHRKKISSGMRIQTSVGNVKHAELADLSRLSLQSLGLLNLQMHEVGKRCGRHLSTSKHQRLYGIGVLCYIRTQASTQHLSDLMNNTFRAQCQCGQLAVSFTQPPVAQLVCHCNDCRSISGVAYARAAFFKAEKVCSDTQLYKQAGNSISVNVLERILNKMI